MTSNGAPQTLPPSTRVDAFDTAGGRILCVADIRGKISKLNALAAEHKATAIIHTGDFGFYERASLARTTDRTLKHMVVYSNHIDDQFKSQLLASNVSPSQMRQMLNQHGQQQQQPNGSTPEKSTSSSSSDFCLSEFPKLLSGELKLSVPVYTVYGAVEDIAVLERLRLAHAGPQNPQTPAASQSGASNKPEPNWAIPNLTILSESCSRVLVLGGVRLRLFGLGGACVSHKMFDNGEGQATIAGANGTMWTTMLQIGELVDTAQRVYDATETRLFVSHASPGREGLLAQVALAIKADFTLSGSLHFRYGSGYNDYSVLPDVEAYRNKFATAKAAFHEVWDTVKSQVEQVVDDAQRKYLDNALAVTNRIPCQPTGPSGQFAEETALRHTWHWNLPDWHFGCLILDIRDGRVGSEMKDQGFNFGYRAHTSNRQQSQGAKTQSALPGAYNSKQNNSPRPSAAATPPPAAKKEPAPPSTTAPAQVQQPQTQQPQQKANPHRREGSLKESKGSLSSPATTDGKLPEKTPFDREKADRPASRASAGSRRGAQHQKNASSRTTASPPPQSAPDSPSTTEQTNATLEQNTRGRGRGGFRGGRGGGGRGGRGEYRGGRGGRGEHKESGSGSSAPAATPTSTPAPAPSTKTE